MTATAGHRYTPSQIEERAKAIWKAMRDECINKALPLIDNGYGPGYHLKGTLVSYAYACWPGTNFRKGSGKTAMNMIRQFLKNSTNAVVLPGGGIFVRDRWADREAVVLVLSERQQAIADREREQRRLEAKVTAEEAGETRTPSPVELRKGPVVVTHPEHGVGKQHKRYENIIVFANGVSQCTDCGKIFIKPTGVSSHVRMHAERQGTLRSVALEQEVQRLRGQLSAQLTDLDPVAAGTMVVDALHALNAQVNALTVEKESLILQLKEAQSSGDAQTKVELIREVLTRVQKGELSMMRALADIGDCVED